MLNKFAGFVIGAVLLAGCAGPNAGSNPAADKPSRRMNAEVCIMSGRSVAADSPSTVFMSKTIKFCCNNCLNDWNRLSEAARTAKLSTRR